MHQRAMAVPRVSQKDAGTRKCESQLQGREPMLKFSTAGLFVVIVLFRDRKMHAIEVAIRLRARSLEEIKIHDRETGDVCSYY